MARRMKAGVTVLAVLVGSTLVTATAVVAAADRKPRTGVTEQPVDRQTIVWRTGKANRAATDVKQWRILPMPRGGCPLGDDPCAISSLPGILVSAKGELSVSLSGNFSRAPVELRLRDDGKVMRPGPVAFHPRLNSNSFSYTFVSDLRGERACREIVLEWRSPTGDPVRINAATMVVHYKHFQPEEPVGCA